MTDLQDMDALANKDLKLGGMVTAVRKGVSKTGKAYGIVTIEDYSGSFEIPLFGQDWPSWGEYMTEGSILMIYAKCQPKQWNPSQLEFRIFKIEYMADAKDRVIESFTLNIPLHALDDDTLLSLETVIKRNPGTATLYIHILDPEGQTNLMLQSRTTKISVGKELISFIENYPALSYRVNGN